MKKWNSLTLAEEKNFWDRSDLNNDWLKQRLKAIGRVSVDIKNQRNEFSKEWVTNFDEWFEQCLATLNGIKSSVDFLLKIQNSIWPKNNPKKD